MLEFIPGIASLTSFGLASSISKLAINEIGRYRAIVYNYLTLMALLLAGALVLGVDLSFPEHLAGQYIIQSIMGGGGVIAAFKAIEQGRVAITSAMNKLFVLFVLVGGVVFFSETISGLQAAGALLLIGSGVVLGLENIGKLRLEKGMLYVAIAIPARAYYYTFIKTFVTELGPYAATVFLEAGVASFVILYYLLRRRDLSPPAPALARFAFLNGLAVFLGSLFYSFSVESVGAALTAAISAGGPIINSIASYFLLQEKLDWHKYVAVMMMVIGLLAIVI